MTSRSELNNFFDVFIKTNQSLNRTKLSIIDAFRKVERESLKLYEDSLGVLERERERVNLAEFADMEQNMLNHLLDFNPKDIDKNIHIVLAYADQLGKYEYELVEVSSALSSLNGLWNAFITRNPEMENSNFDKYFKERYQELSQRTEKTNISIMGNLVSDISNAHTEFQKIIAQIETIKSYVERNIFIGEESEQIHVRLKELIDKSSEYSISEFFSIAGQEIARADTIKNNSEKGRVPVPVVKVINSQMPHIYKYTLRFANNIVAYESFFMENELNSSHIQDFKNWEDQYKQTILLKNSASKVLESIETGEFIYVDNFPLNGIFDGKEVIGSISLSKDYLVAVEEFSGKALASFVLTFFIILGTTGVFSFFGAFGVVLNIIVIAMLLVGFKGFLQYMKETDEKKRGLKDFFIFSKNNFFIASMGDTFHVDDALLGAIQDFDNTILNKDFHKLLQKNERFVRKNIVIKKDGKNG